MRTKNDSLTFDSTDLSGNCTSGGVGIAHISQFAVQVVTSGIHAGTLKVQGSCDAGAPNASSEALQVVDVTNWSDIATADISNSGTYLINVVDAGYNFFRVVYVKNTGTGSITSARFNAKGV